MPPEKIFVTTLRDMPAFVLYKCTVTTQIDIHWLSAFRAVRNQSIINAIMARLIVASHKPLCSQIVCK